MARVTKVRVGFRQTINIGNFENITPLVELEADLEPGDELNEVFLQVHKDCEELFMKEVHGQIAIVAQVRGIKVK